MQYNYELILTYLYCGNQLCDLDLSKSTKILSSCILPLFFFLVVLQSFHMPLLLSSNKKYHSIRLRKKQKIKSETFFIFVKNWFGPHSYHFDKTNPTNEPRCIRQIFYLIIRASETIVARFLVWLCHTRIKEMDTTNTSSTNTHIQTARDSVHVHI